MHLRDNKVLIRQVFLKMESGTPEHVGERWNIIKSVHLVGIEDIRCKVEEINWMVKKVFHNWYCTV